MQSKESFFRPIFILKGVLAVSLSFTGCGKLMEYGNSNGNTQPQRAATPATQANAANSTAAPQIPAGPAIATADGDMPGIRIEVQELKRTSGDTVTLKFAMINDSDKEMTIPSGKFGEEGRGNPDNRSVGGVTLIDAAGKKKYFVVRDTENQCLCSRDMPNISSKSRTQLWAKFPAPPGDVQKITVVVPHFIPMDDVPISQ